MTPPKVWLITGTSSGFGRRLVGIVLARGDRVIATARTLAKIDVNDSDFLDNPELDPNIHCAELDISAGTDNVKTQVDLAVQASGWGTVDVLVNNAGMGLPAFLEEGGADKMKQQYQTNVFGTLDVTNAVLPYMRQQKSGTVVVMGSRSGWKTEIKVGTFRVFLCLAIAETMALELEPLGIRVLIVEPGAFRTEGIYGNQFDESRPISDYDEERKKVGAMFSATAGKQPGDPVKAMKAVVEVVCGEGRAKGKDADRDVRSKCARMIRHLDEWSDVVGDVDLDQATS
ncbi:NAD(P)-binding protein [Gyrodon lividus]|nr:NAD(P)-binding protein [Gyrodon lividus]